MTLGFCIAFMISGSENNASMPGGTPPPANFLSNVSMFSREVTAYSLLRAFVCVLFPPLASASPGSSSRLMGCLVFFFGLPRLPPPAAAAG